MRMECEESFMLTRRPQHWDGSLTTPTYSATVSSCSFWAQLCKCVLFNVFYPIQNKSLQPSQSEVQPSCEPSHLSMPFGTGQRGFVNVLQVVASTTNQTCWIMGRISSNSFTIKTIHSPLHLWHAWWFRSCAAWTAQVGCQKPHLWCKRKGWTNWHPRSHHSIIPIPHLGPTRVLLCVVVKIFIQHHLKRCWQYIVWVQAPMIADYGTILTLLTITAKR